MVTCKTFSFDTIESFRGENTSADLGLGLFHFLSLAHAFVELVLCCLINLLEGRSNEIVLVHWGSWTLKISQETNGATDFDNNYSACTSM